MYSAQAFLEIAFTVVTPLLQTVTIASAFKIMFSIVLLILVMAALATSNWVRCCVDSDFRLTVG